MDLEALYNQQIKDLRNELRRAQHGAKGVKASRREIMSIHAALLTAQDSLSRYLHRSGELQESASAGMRFKDGEPCCSRCGAKLPREIEVRFCVTYEQAERRALSQ